MKTDTPRTDAFLESGPLQRPSLTDLADFARKLERENAKMQEAIKRALADSESGNGWGPDLTVCGYLRDALQDSFYENPFICD